MALGYLGSFIVGGLLMLLVVTMVRVNKIAELADFVLKVNGTDLCIVKLGI